MTAPNKPIEIWQLDDPVIESGGILVETVASEVCGTDVHLLRGQLAGVPYPIVPGHVSVGKVLEMRDVDADALGTPLVAAESGFANFSTNRLGGNAIWLQGSSGTKYYYAHLSSWEGSSRAVTRGETIGYVGATGNTTANHLHFEVHPGGGRAVNPYPYVRNVC